MSKFINEESIKKLIEIKEWIHENYEGHKTYAENINPEDVGKEGQNLLLEKIGDFFKYNILGLCGCGTPETTLMAIASYLKIIVLNHDDEKGGFIEGRKVMKKKFKVEYVTDDPLLQYMAYDLDGRGVIEHGGNINGAWISEVGEKCLYVFDLLLKIETETCTKDECKKCKYKHLCKD